MGHARRSAAVLLTAVLGGCATMTTMTAEQGHRFGPYSGLRLDLKAVEVTDDDTVRRLSYADLPLSFACDTALLPVSLLSLVLPEGFIYRPAY